MQLLPDDFFIKLLVSLIHKATTSAINTGITPNRNGRPLNSPPYQ